MKVIKEHIKKVKKILKEKGELITLEELKQFYDKNKIEKELKEDEIKELKPYVQEIYKKRLRFNESNFKVSFYNQFANGSGNELQEHVYYNERYSKWIRTPAKFFNVKSSSRLAFELYSWMINEAKVQDLQFEYKLPKLNGGNNPNMDVYILHNNTITFIESKYTETKNNKTSNIPDAYYIEKDKAYRTKKDEKGELVPLKSTLLQRYNEKEVIKNSFVDFIKDGVIKYMEDYNKDSCEEDQYDVKQEIAHLLGIAFFMVDKSIDSKIFIDEIEIKKIQFYNIVYDFGIKQSQLSLEIMKLANSLFQNLIEVYNLDIEFEYRFKFIQDMIKENKDKFMKAKAYGCNCSVSDKLKQFDINVEGLCNENTRN